MEIAIPRIMLGMIGPEVVLVVTARALRIHGGGQEKGGPKRGQWQQDGEQPSQEAGESVAPAFALHGVVP